MEKIWRNWRIEWNSNSAYGSHVIVWITMQKSSPDFPVFCWQGFGNFEPPPEELWWQLSARIFAILSLGAMLLQHLQPHLSNLIETESYGPVVTVVVWFCSRHAPASICLVLCIYIEIHKSKRRSRQGSKYLVPYPSLIITWLPDVDLARLPTLCFIDRRGKTLCWTLHGVTPQRRDNTHTHLYNICI